MYLNIAQTTLPVTTGDETNTWERTNSNRQLPTQAGGDYSHTIIHDSEDSLRGIGNGLQHNQLPMEEILMQSSTEEVLDTSTERKNSLPGTKKKEQMRHVEISITKYEGWGFHIHYNEVTQNVPTNEREQN